IVEAGTIKYSEPTLLASILQCLDQHGGAALGYCTRQGLNVRPFFVLTGQIGEIVDRNGNTLRGGWDSAKVMTLLRHRCVNRLKYPFRWDCLAPAEHSHASAYKRNHCDCFPKAQAV